MQNENGFTLIEVMITVAIVAIIAVVAIPSYQAQAMKAKRSDAMIALTQAAAMQERTLTKTGNYTSAEGALIPTGSVTENDHYNFYSFLPDETDRTVSATVRDAASGGTETLEIDVNCSGRRCFVLAVATRPSQASDVTCSIMTLDSVGRQMSYNSDGDLNTPGTCWK